MTGLPDSSVFAYVGSRTTQTRQARGRGISVWRASRAPEPWRLEQMIDADRDNLSGEPTAGTIPINPSFLTLDRAGHHLYVVHGDSAYLSALAVDQATGRLSLIGTTVTEGRNPVHLSIDPSGHWLIVANLWSGSVTSHPIRADSSVGGAVGTLDFPGTPGPHSVQTVSNPHQASFDPSGRWIVIPDRGLDRVFVASFDESTGRLALSRHRWMEARTGDGPRHIAWNPELPAAYVVNELASTVTTCRWDDSTGTLTALQTVSASAPQMGESRAGEIAVGPAGRFVYVSNRSGAGDDEPGGPESDTIGQFRVVDSTGVLDAIGWIPTNGIRPRFFAFDPDARRVYVANERSDSIAGFDVDPRDGILRPTGEVATTGSPVCIALRRWVPLR